MSMALDNPLPLHAPQHACFTTARLPALATSLRQVPHARMPTSPTPTLRHPLAYVIRYPIPCTHIPPALAAVELAHLPMCPEYLCFLREVDGPMDRRSWRSLKRLERAARSSCSCLLPPPSAARSPHRPIPSPCIPSQPLPLNSKTPSQANRTKSTHPHRMNFASIRRTVVGSSRARGVGVPCVSVVDLGARMGLHAKVRKGYRVYLFAATFDHRYLLNRPPPPSHPRPHLRTLRAP